MCVYIYTYIYTSYVYARIYIMRVPEKKLGVLFKTKQNNKNKNNNKERKKIKIKR